MNNSPALGYPDGFFCLLSVPEQVHKQLYLIVEAGEARLCGFVPAISAMAGEEVLALPP